MRLTQDAQVKPSTGRTSSVDPVGASVRRGIVGSVAFIIPDTTGGIPTGFAPAASYWVRAAPPVVVVVVAAASAPSMSSPASAASSPSTASRSGTAPILERSAQAVPCLLARSGRTTRRRFVAQPA